MAIIEPETDIKLWISIISQSIQSLEDLNLSLPSIKTVFSEIIDDHNCLPSKYKIEESDFYRLIFVHILNPILQLEKINNSESVNSKQIISEVLNCFINLSNASLCIDDPSLKDIILLLFQQNNKLYNLDKKFYDEACDSFINLGLFSQFLEYLDNIPDLSQSLKSNNDEIKNIQIANKIPFLVNSLISCIPYLRSESEINWKSISLKCMVPLIKLYQYISEKNANYVFCLILNEMIFEKQIDTEIINFWVTIFKLYLKTDNFSLILFTLSATVEMMKRSDFKKTLFSIYKQPDNRDEIIKLYLNISIHEEYCRFLQDIYSYFLIDGLINIDDLIPLWKSQKTAHISLIPSLLSIFINISNYVTNESAKQLTDMVINFGFLTEEWLKCVAQIALKLNSRKENVSKFTNLLTQISSNKFNFDKLSKKEINTFKKIADETLPQLLTNSYNSQNYLSFLKEVSNKISTKKETKNDIEVLCNSLPNFNTGKKKMQDIQELFEKIISIFSKYNLNTMKKIVDILMSESYGCTINERLLKKFLSFTSNDKICSELYSFIIDLSIQKDRIPIGLLLKVMVNSDLEINSSFYHTIKSIILTLNEGGIKIDKFPFNEEDVVWYFCFLKNPQIKHFQKLLSRLYMRNAISDKEMVESFISNSIKRFKMMYYKAKNEKSKNEAIDIFCSLLFIFLEKIESYIYVPFNYHFSEHKENNIKIQINKDNQMNFDFDQRRTVSSLIHYIQITNKIKNDIIIKYNDQDLNEKNTIEQEIGLEKLKSMKNEKKPLLLTFSIQKVISNDSIRQNRTFLPSLFIINNIKGLLDILFQSDLYPNLFYKLPTFEETLIQVRNLNSKDFSTFFPYNNPIKFQYNFECFLDVYSSQQYNLLQEEGINDSFIKESGLIDYLINCGLSTSFPTLIHLILSFIKDFYNKNNEDVIDNEILADQFIGLIQGFIKPDQKTYVISNIFSIKIKSLPSLSQDLLYQMLMHKIPSFRAEARDFLKEIEIPLSYYSAIYDKSKYEPNEEFYLSMGDHILLSKKRDDRTIKIIIVNCQKKNPYHAYLYCIDAALRKNMFDSNEKNIIANYLANNFIIEQIDCLPKYCFNEAMQIASYFSHPAIIKAINELFNQFDFSEHLLRRTSCDKLLIDGDEIVFRSYARSTDKNEVDYINFPIGLKNLGATCYANAVIQQLFNINDFRNDICKDDDAVKNNELVISLHKLFFELQVSYLNIVDPSMFLKAYGIADTGIQCDCCEFLQQLLNSLKVHIFEVKIKNIISAIDNEQLKVESYDSCEILPLPIRNISTIEESFKHFSSSDFFKNYSFTNSTKCDAKKVSFIHELSNHLIIQLKRFEYNHQKQICEKITSTLSFGDELSFGDISFHLTGVIIHIGESAESGHYISYTRRFSSDQWFEYNDSDVTRVNHKYVLETANKNGYLLFYSKNDNKSVKYYNFKQIRDKNKYESVCRMLFSNSFSNAMMQICKNMNLSNLPLSKITLFYFFQLLPIYRNKEIQSNFGSILLSKVKKSKENNDEQFITTMIYSIFEYWSAIKMESPLLYAEYSIFRHYACEILKIVASQIDCFEEIQNIVQASNLNWFYYLYSSNELFDLINFVFEKNPQSLTQISVENNWVSIFENFIISVIQCQKINYDNLNLHFFAQIFVRIGFTDRFESTLCKNIQFITLLLSSNTPIDDIINIINKLKRKEEVVKLLNDIQPRTQQLESLLSKLC